MIRSSVIFKSTQMRFIFVLLILSGCSGSTEKPSPPMPAVLAPKIEKVTTGPDDPPGVLRVGKPFKVTGSFSLEGDDALKRNTWIIASIVTQTAKGELIIWQGEAKLKPIEGRQYQYEVAGSAAPRRFGKHFLRIHSPGQKNLAEVAVEIR